MVLLWYCLITASIPPFGTVVVTPTQLNVQAHTSYLEHQRAVDPYCAQDLKSEPRGHVGVLIGLLMHRNPPETEVQSRMRRIPTKKNIAP